METFIVFTIISLISVIFFLLTKKETNKGFSNPDQVLRSVKAINTNSSFQNQLAIHNLKKSLELNPNHEGLFSKLKEIEAFNKKTTTFKPNLVIISILLSLGIVLPAIYWSLNIIHLYGLTLVILFLLGGLIYFIRHLIKTKSA